MSDEDLNEFIVEAEELLVEAEDALLEIDKGSEFFQENINKLVRCFHSIKGVAGMFDLNATQKHFYYLESLIEKKKTSNKLSSLVIDYLFSAIDLSRDLISGKQVDFKYYDPDEDNTKSQEEVNSVIATLKEQATKRSKDKLGDILCYVVDDEDDILELIEIALLDSGVRVKTFNNPLECLDTIVNDHPDVVVTDISMPEINGIDLMSRVNHIFPSIPVIIVSGFVTKEICIETLSLGVAGIIEKPFKSDQITSLVKHTAQRYKSLKLLNSSLDILVKHYKDLSHFTNSTGSQFNIENLKSDLKKILLQKKKILTFHRNE